MHNLNFALGFFSACGILIVTSLLLISIKSRRLNAIEERRSAKFASSEKGFLDHQLNLTQAIKEFQKVLNEIGAEIGRSGTAAGKIGKKFALAGNNARFAHRAASVGAARLDKHAIRMERALTKFEGTVSLMIESTAGFLGWITPTTEAEKQPLIETRSSLVSLIELTQNSVSTTETYRNGLLKVKGISQEMNSAINRQVSVIDVVIATLQKSEKHWKELIEVIDGKLDYEPPQNVGLTPSS